MYNIDAPERYAAESFIAFTPKLLVVVSRLPSCNEALVEILNQPTVCFRSPAIQHYYSRS